MNQNPSIAMFAMLALLAPSAARALNKPIDMDKSFLGLFFNVIWQCLINPIQGFRAPLEFET